jgi:hypothetical protein
MALQVDQDRAKARAAPKRKLVDAKPEDRPGEPVGESQNAAQNGVARRLDPQAGGEPGSPLAAGRQTDGDNLLSVPDRRSGSWLNKVREPFGKDFPFTVGVAAGELPNGEEQLNPTACTRHIPQGSAVVTMDRGGHFSTHRATSRRGGGNGLDEETLLGDLDLVNHDAFWQGKQASLFHLNLVRNAKEPSSTGFSWKRLYQYSSIGFLASGH